MNRTILSLSLFAAFPLLAGGPFTLASRELSPGRTIGDAQVLKGFGCEGGNVSPSLSWSNAPEGTRSFVLMCLDPDAPTGSGWWHWVVFDIPAGTQGLPAGAGSGQAPMPSGAVQSRTDFGFPGYGGPCPPKGDAPHHYLFTLYALKTDKLELSPDASPAMVSFMARSQALGKAELTAVYGR